MVKRCFLIISSCLHVAAFKSLLSNRRPHYTATSTSIFTATWSGYRTYPFQDEYKSISTKDPLRLTTFRRTRRKTPIGKYNIYCDLDGVLVDFAKGIQEIFPENPPQSSSEIQELKNNDVLWRRVASADNFFQHLDWMPEGHILWESIKHLDPDILTGVPPSISSRREKFLWCQRELTGVSKIVHVDRAGKWSRHHGVGDVQENTCNVITCWSHNKHFESGPNSVLIDDRPSLRNKWEEKGGIFIHHVPGQVDKTLRQLRQHGIL
mmetsp:Transcript_12238/g.18768  ORF Transcript_12238/g.18768 Transcript_12238/m.18768 type:complete len:265 (-) Transcript_12238:198-992(-)